MLDLDVFKINPITGYAVRQIRSSGGLVMNFVGLGYGINGTVSADPGYTYQGMNLSQISRVRVSTNRPTDPEVGQVLVGVESENLGYMSNLKLPRYRARMGLSGGMGLRYELRNVTIQLPVKTQA